MNPLRALSRYARRASEPAAGERCELCSDPIGEGHRHVVEPGRREVMCACRPCAILFDQPGSGARYRTVPDRVLVDPALTLTPELWRAVGAPVHLVFVVRDAAGHPTALYPSPAGTADAELSEDGWAALGRRTPLVGALEPEVEALVVYGRRGASHLACYLAPIDLCWELSGRVRRLWQGFDGGDEVRAELERFFTELGRRARPITREERP